MIIRKSNEHDAMGIARVHVDSWKATYEGIIFEGYLKKFLMKSDTIAGESP